MPTPRYAVATWQASPNHSDGHSGRKAVVLHIAQGNYQGSITYMVGAGVSSHFMIGRVGQTSQMVEVDDSAWGNGLLWADRASQLPKGYKWQGPGWYCPHKRKVTPGWQDITPRVNPNLQTISVEHEGFSGEVQPGAQRTALVRLLVWIGQQFPELLPWVPGRTLIRHADIDPIDKGFCPGRGFDLVAIAAEANQLASITTTTPPVEPWVRSWERLGVALPTDQVGWAIPQLYKTNALVLGACLEPESYFAGGALSLAVFERGLIYYLKSTERAYLQAFPQSIGGNDVA